MARSQVNNEKITWFTMNNKQKYKRRNVVAYRRVSGFTLLELLVVVGIMAALAGVAYMASGSRISDSKLIAADSEMLNIRAALLRYRQDNFEFPDQDSAVDAGFLFDQTLAGVNSWDADYQRGWRGPYLHSGDSGLVDIGDGIGLNGTGSPHVVVAAAYKTQRAIPDPFVAFPVDVGIKKPNLAAICDDSPNINNACLFDWRLLGQVDTDDPISRRGRPYFLFDLDSEGARGARIVSLGPNGVYDSSGRACPAAADGDDIVLCLY
jgi:prepilin-type N-terminal cleavage/methylation domain-containing protein